MKATQWIILAAVGIVAIVAWFTFRSSSPKSNIYNPNVKNPFGTGGPSPPISNPAGSGRPGAPVSPVPGSVGATLNEIDTGVNAASKLAVDLNTTKEALKDLFN